MSASPHTNGHGEPGLFTEPRPGDIARSWAPWQTVLLWEGQTYRPAFLNVDQVAYGLPPKEAPCPQL